MNTQKDKIEKWKNSMIDSTKRVYNQDGDLMPVAMLYTEDDGIMIIGMPFNNQKQKEMSAEAVKSLVREHKAIAVIFIHEGYMKSFSKDEKDKFLNPDGTKKVLIKDIEGNKEVIVITFETKEGYSEITTIEINDKELGKQNVKIGKLGGLFSNFFAPPVWAN